MEDFCGFAITGDDCKHEGKNTQHGENVSGDNRIIRFFFFFLIIIIFFLRLYFI